MASFRTRDDRPNNPIQARVVGSEGPVSKSFKNITDAKRWAHGMEVDVQRGEFHHSKAGDRTFSRYAEGWLDDRKLTLAPGTWKRDESYLASMISPTFGALRVRNITGTDITRWLAGLDRADSTKAKAVQIVGGVLDRARRDGAIRANPVRDLPSRPPQRPRRKGRALSDDELERLIDAAYQVGGGLIVVTMARLGLRIGEALALRRSDLVGDRLTVQRSRDRDGSTRPLKGRTAGDHRTVPLPLDVQEAFKSHTVDTPLITGDLFVTSLGTPLTYTYWRRSRWLPTLDRAAIDDVVPQDLRRTCVTRLFVVDNWSPAEVQAFVGHTDARVTLEVYASVNSRDLPIPSTLQHSKTGGSAI